jgi:hypothetical protein
LYKTYRGVAHSANYERKRHFAIPRHTSLGEWCAPRTYLPRDAGGEATSQRETTRETEDGNTEENNKKRRAPLRQSFAVPRKAQPSNAVLDASHACDRFCRMCKNEFHTSDSDQPARKNEQSPLINRDSSIRWSTRRDAHFSFLLGARGGFPYRSDSRRGSRPPWYFNFRVKLHVAQSNI